MRVDFIGHASLLIRSGELALLTDPWWAGPAYQGQWYPYPFPVPERYDLDRVTALYISHGHEDHLHPATLRELRRDLEVVIPRSYDAGNRDYLASLGFRRIREVRSRSSITLRRGASRMRLTLFTHMGDSMLAVEADGEVLLDVNDALHCARSEVIDEYCRIIGEQLPRIDYLFSGFGGASYFPNCFRLPGKDDVAVARRREELFIANVARVARRLRPRHLFPFAAHFVLPDERNWWVSRMRLEMPNPAELLATASRGEGVAFHDLSPGDHVDRGRVVSTPSAPPGDVDRVRGEVLARYPVAAAPERITQGAFLSVVARLRENAAPQEGPPLRAAIKLTDFPDAAILVRRSTGGPELSIAEPETLARFDPALTLETRSSILRAAAEDAFGRDLICIGYGGLLHFRSRDAIAANLHEHLLSLVTRFPSWADRVRKHPVMTMAYFARDPGARLALRNQLDLRRHAGSLFGGAPPAPRNRLYSLEEWI